MKEYSEDLIKVLIKTLKRGCILYKTESWEAGQRLFTEAERLKNSINLIDGSGIYIIYVIVDSEDKFIIERCFDDGRSEIETYKF